MVAGGASVVSFTKRTACQCIHCGTTDEERFDLRPKLGSRGVCVDCKTSQRYRQRAAIANRLATIDELPQCADEPDGCGIRHHSVDGSGFCAFCRLERVGRRLSDVLRRTAA